MFAALLGFLPVIGTIVSGVTGYLSTRNEMKMTKDKNDLEEVKLRIENQRKDVRLQLQQDMIVFPVSAWMMLYGWDKIVAVKYPDLVWGVAPFGEYALMASLPVIVLAYLFSIPIRDKITK